MMFMVQIIVQLWWSLILIFNFILILIDQIIKIITVKFIKDIVIIDNFFYLSYVKNYGASFSILNGYSFLLIILGLISLLLIYKFYQEEDNFIIKKMYLLLSSGIISNSLDRLFRGYVVDTFRFKIFNIDMPVFNFADILIVLSAIFIVISLLRKELYDKDKSRKK